MASTPLSSIITSVSENIVNRSLLLSIIHDHSFEIVRFSPSKEIYEFVTDGMIFTCRTNDGRPGPVYPIKANEPRYAALSGFRAPILRKAV